METENNNSCRSKNSRAIFFTIIISLFFTSVSLHGVDMELYVDDDFGFSVDYPVGWVVRTEAGKSVAFSSSGDFSGPQKSGAGFGVVFLPAAEVDVSDEKALFEMLTGKSQGEIGPIEKEFLGGHQAVFVQFVDTDDNISGQMFVISMEQVAIMVVTAIHPPDLESIYRPILDSMLDSLSLPSR